MLKTIIFIKSDGLLNTIKFIWKGIVSKLYYQSQTLCLYGKRTDIDIKTKAMWNTFQCRMLKDVDELERLDFDRLKLLPYHQWLDNGSKLYILFKDDIPVAFGWTHFGKHKIDNVGNFNMGDDVAWLGPYFVHHKYRGNGLQQLVIQQGIETAPVNIKAFITSVNVSNMPSLYSFEKNGFKIGMKVLCKTGYLVSSKRTNIEIIDKCSEKYLKIVK